MTLQLVGNYEHLSRDLQFALTYPAALASLLAPVHGYLLELFGTSKAASGLEREKYLLLGYHIVYGSLPFVYLSFVVVGLLWIRQRIHIREWHQIPGWEKAHNTVMAGKQGAVELM